MTVDVQAASKNPMDGCYLRPTKYLSFDQIDNPKGETGIWLVRSKRSGATLGTIKWYGPQRQYCFWPTGATIFNRVHLAVITDRIDTCNRVQRNVRKTVIG